MGRVTGSYSRPVKGVSQQPEKIRADGFCTASENFVPDVVHGLITRPELKLRGHGSTQVVDHPRTKIHTYQRGDNEHYFIFIDNHGNLSVYDFYGGKQNVTISNGKSYITDSTPVQNLDLQTVGDTTFITNRKKTVGLYAGSNTPDINTNTKAVVTVNHMEYAQSFNIFFSNSPTGATTDVASLTAPDGTGANDLTQLDQIHVAQQLYTQLSANLHGATVTRHSNCIFIESQGDWRLWGTDGKDGASMTVVRGSVVDTGQLPPLAPEGMRVQVRPRGSTEHSKDRFWVKATAYESGEPVVWNETVAPGTYQSIDYSTMPHRLVRSSIGSDGVANFVLTTASWYDRDVGDNTTNPMPAFVGSTIHSTGVFQDRMFFISGERIHFSRAANLYSLFKTTTQASLDDDPVEVVVQGSKINELKTYNVMDGDLILFSDSAQFKISGEVALTPATGVITMEAQFKADTTVAPASLGEGLAFVYSEGLYTQVREFFTRSIADTKGSLPLTENASKYLYGYPEEIVSDPSTGTLIARMMGDDNLLYVYRWAMEGGEKIQSAWSRWALPHGTVIHKMSFLDHRLYIALTRPHDTEVSFDWIDMGEIIPREGVDPHRLDFLTGMTATYVSARDRWEISTDTLPNIPADQLVGVKSGGAYDEELGQDFSLKRDGSTLYTDTQLADEINGAQVFVYYGMPIECKYIPTSPIIRDQYGKPYLIDSLMIGDIRMNVEQYGNTQVAVEDKYGRSTTYDFNQRSVDQPNNVAGFVTPQDGTLRIPVRQRASDVKIVVTTNSHKVLQVRDFEYTGQWSPRGYRR